MSASPAAAAADTNVPDLNRDAGDAYLRERLAANSPEARLQRLIALGNEGAAPAAPAGGIGADAPTGDTGVVDVARAEPAASKPQDGFMIGWLKRAFPGTVKAPPGSAMRSATDAAGAVARDVAKGVGIEGPGSVVRGMTGAVNETAKTIGAVADAAYSAMPDFLKGGWLDGVAALRTARPDFKPSDAVAELPQIFGEHATTTAHLIEGTAQWLTSAALTRGLSTALGIPANAWTATINDFVAGAVGFDPRAARISNAVDDAAPNPVTAFLKADAEDPELLARLKNGLETAGLAKIAEGVIGALRFLKASAKAKDAPAQPGAPAAAPAGSAAAESPAPAAAKIGAGGRRYIDVGGEQYVSTAKGSSELARVPPDIAASAGVDPAVIRLPRGYQGQGPGGGGRGELHIEAGHGAQIRALGYGDAAEFVAEVAARFNEVRRDPNGKLYLVLRDEAVGAQSGRAKQNTLLVELAPSGDGGAYDVVTAGPFRNNYLEKKELLWQGVRGAPTRPGGSDAPLSPRPQDGSASGELESARGQSATVIPNAGAVGKSGSLADELAGLERPGDFQSPRGIVEITPDIAEKARAFLAGETSEAPVRINLAHIEGPEDLLAAVAEISKALPERPVTHAETLASARLFAIDQQGNFDNVAGTVFDSKQITAARLSFVSVVQNDVQPLALKIQSGTATEADKAAFERVWGQALVLRNLVVEQAAQLGRGLNAMGIAAKSDPEIIKAVRALMEQQAEAPLPTEKLAAMVSSFADPAQAAEFVARTANPRTTRDTVVYWWSNILLSNPSSHIANVADTGMSTLLQVPETWVASKIGALTGSGSVEAGEATARLYGIVQGMQDGVRLAARALRTGDSQFGGPATRVEGAVLDKSVSGADLAKAGPMAQAADYLKMLLPTRLMMAGDELTKAMNYRGELNRLVFRRASIEEGRTGDDLAKRMGELMSNPPPALDDAAQAWAIKGTFNSELSGFGAHVASAVDAANVAGIPVGRIVMPFVRTPANILGWMVQRTPAAFLSPTVMADLAAGGAQRDLALARIATGSALLGGFADMTMQGKITGAGPKDPGLRANLLRQDENGNAQWQPYSIKIGDTWHSYARSGTVGSLIGLAADATELISGAYNREPKAINMDGTPVEDGAAAAVVFPFAQALLNKTYMSGLSSLMDALSDPHRNGEPYLQRTVASLVPSGVGALERSVDGEMRRASGYLEALQARIPGLSDSLPPRLTLWGDPAKDTNGIYNLFLPVRQMKDGGNPIDKWMAEARVAIQPPAQIQPFGSGASRIAVKLTPEQHNRLIALAGNGVKGAGNDLGARDFLNALVEGKADKVGFRLVAEWASGSDDKREIIVRETVAKYREAARNKLLAEDGDLAELVRQQRMVRGEKVQAPRAPDGAANSNPAIK